MAEFIRLGEVAVNLDAIKSLWLKEEGVVVNFGNQAFTFDGPAGELLRWWLLESGQVTELGQQRREAAEDARRRRAMIAELEGGV